MRRTCTEILEERAQFSRMPGFCGRGKVRGGLVREVPVPILAQLQVVRPDVEPVTARQLVDLFEAGLGRGDVWKRQVGVNGLRIDVEADRRILQQGLDLGSEPKAPVPGGVIERLLSHPITGNVKLALSHVPNREGKHPTQLLGTADAELLVEVDDRLGVAVGAELVASLAKPCPEFEVVIDLSIEDDPEGAVLVAERLMTST